MDAHSARIFSHKSSQSSAAQPSMTYLVKRFRCNQTRGEDRFLVRSPLDLPPCLPPALVAAGAGCPSRVRVSRSQPHDLRGGISGAHHPSIHQRRPAAHLLLQEWPRAHRLPLQLAHVRLGSRVYWLLCVCGAMRSRVGAASGFRVSSPWF